MSKIYDLKSGDDFRIVSSDEVFCGQYHVDNIIEHVALCTSEASGKLMLPLNVAMPFAVLVGRGAPENAVAVPVKQPEAIEPEKAEEETPAEETAVEQAEQPSEVHAEEESVRKEGELAYFNGEGQWGKISHERFRRGLFFHISEVEDDELRAMLSAILPGEGFPKCRVSYIERVNNHRFNNNVNAARVRLVELLEQEAKPAATEEPENKTGYLDAYSNGRGKITCNSPDRSYSFKLEDVRDEHLSMFLKKYMPMTSAEGLNLKVSFKVVNDAAAEIVWENKDDCTVVDMKTLNDDLSEDL